MYIGVDVGGTFTDAVLIDGERAWTAKSPTTANFTDGVIAACEMAAQRSGHTLREVLPRVSRFGLGTTAVTNMITSRRGSVPNPGGAGGGLGARTSLRILRGNGAIEDVPLQAAGASVREGERFELCGPTAGGFGDPLLRPIELVEQDILQGRITVEEAEDFYGVIMTSGRADRPASEALRETCRVGRLRQARPPVRPVAAEPVKSPVGLPLYPGVVQVGSLAVAEASGAVLAEAPHSWTEGCLVLDEQDAGPNGYAAVTRSYLDPVSGRRLLLEILQRDGSSIFECSPDRWTGRSTVQGEPTDEHYH